MNKILVTDDERSIRESFTLILEGKYRVVTAASGEGALKAVADQKIDLAFLDIRMPGLDGLETLKRLKELDPEVDVIMVTAVNDVQKASEAIKLGARDYLIKPFDVEAIHKMTAAVLARQELARASRRALRPAAPLTGQSDKIKALNQFIEKTGAQDGPVLLLGEAGTEKALAALALHDKSPRHTLPFVTCQLTAKMSAKNELFGQTKGTTVVDLAKKSGALERARGGTLYINNIEYLPVELLPDLRQSGVRLIAASSGELPDKVKEFFGPSVITLPPLRDRLTDLPVIATGILDDLSRLYHRENVELTPEAAEALGSYAWPGNVAQLKALLEKVMLTTKKTRIEVNDLPLEFAQSRTRVGTA